MVYATSHVPFLRLVVPPICRNRLEEDSGWCWAWTTQKHIALDLMLAFHEFITLSTVNSSMASSQI
jgi:hypothetical protein